MRQPRAFKILDHTATLALKTQAASTLACLSWQHRQSCAACSTIAVTVEAAPNANISTKAPAGLICGISLSLCSVCRARNQSQKVDMPHHIWKTKGVYAAQESQSSVCVGRTSHATIFSQLQNGSRPLMHAMLKLQVNARWLSSSC